MDSAITLTELQRQLDQPPYQRFLKMTAESLDSERGRVRLRLPFRPEYQRSQDRPEIHGGVISGFIDIAGDYALVASLGYGVPTINLRVDYLRMAVGVDLIADAWVIKAGRSIGVVDVRVNDDSGKEIAIGRANYSTANR